MSSKYTFRIIACVYFLAIFHPCTPKADGGRLQKIKPWGITINDNGYNILVGISEDISESDGKVLIDNLKKLLTTASEKFHSITGGRASFNKIRIVVPNNWTSYSDFSDGETTSKANIYVNKDSTNQAPGVLRYVKKSKKPYRAILLPASYVNQRSNEADAGEMILEKWFTLQYGLIRSYLDLTNELQTNAPCSNPSNRNEVCKALRSELIWQLKRNSSQPNFEVVRQRSQRVVMIVDVSGSMYYNDRLVKAKEGLKHYIKTKENLPGTSLGIVQFSTTAETISNLTNIEREKSALKNIVKDLNQESGTSIGAGLEEALKVLNRHPEKTDGSEFILISDGKEVARPFINQTSQTLINSDVTVHTIAITDMADVKMDGLGAATGGLTFIHRDNERGNDIGTAFSEIANYEQSDPAASGIVIFSERKKTANPRFRISIDERIGSNTTFTFECSLKSCSFWATIESESKNFSLRYHFTANSRPKMTPEYEIRPNRRAGQLDVEVYDAEVGDWTIRTQYSDRYNDLGLTVRSKPRDISNYPILAFSFWGEDQIFEDDCANQQTMYTLITRDNNPVINADVKAYIEANVTHGPFSLFDDGRGRDSAAEDGIYVGEFPTRILNRRFTERFNMKVVVNGTTATQVRTRQLVAASNEGYGPQDVEPVMRLQRFVMGGSFISLAQHQDECKVCNVDLVFMIKTSRLRDLQKFLFGMVVSFTSKPKKARVRIGIISMGDQPKLELHVTGDTNSVVGALTFSTFSSSSRNKPDFAEGFRYAAVLLSDTERSRRKVIVLVTEENIDSNDSQTLKEAENLRGEGVTIIPVGVTDAPQDYDLARIAGINTNVVRISDYSDAEEQETRIINLSCGFILKGPRPNKPLP